MALILFLSILLQISAAVLAFRSIATAGQRLAWGLIAAAVSLMAVQCSFALYDLLSAQQQYAVSLTTGLLTLAVSALLPIGIASVSRIIESMGRSQEESLESERTLSTLIDNLPGIAYRCRNDADWTMEFISDRAFEITGYSAADLTLNRHASYGDVIHAEDRERIWKTVQQAIESHRAFEIVYRINTANGQEKWAWERGRGIYGPNQEILFIEGFITDITKQKTTEISLRESEERFRELAENIREVFWLFDWKRQTVIYVSPAYEKIWGRSSKALYERYEEWQNSIHPDDRERARVTFFSNVESGGGKENQYRIIRPDGSIRWILDRAFAIYDEDGQLTRVAGIAEDVTDRKELEEQFLQSQKMEAVGRLAGGIAHDFNNLLTVISGYCGNLAASDALTKEQVCQINEIAKAGEKAAALTGQLLTFSRQQLARSQVLDLSAAVANIETMIQRMIGEDVRIFLATEAQPTNISADPGQIEQVLMNLAVNARDAMPQGGELHIEILTVAAEDVHALQGDPPRCPTYVVLTVRDTGCGMESAVLEKAFDPFYTTKEVGKGTGLGLSTVYGIVKQSKGHIAVESEPGRGTTFRMYFPSADNIPKSRSDTEDTRGPCCGTETILLVEDENAVRKLFGRMLREYGYEVHEAQDGDEAVRLFQEMPKEVDLLITDVVMPEMNGRELADRLSEIRRDIRVLYISGYTRDFIDHHQLEDGAMDFMQKPFSPHDLARKVRELLDRPEPAS